MGNVLLSADEVGLTGLWFDGGRYYAETLPEEHVERETPILMDTKRWLDVYFTGREPDFTPPLHPAGSPFRQAVWQLLLEIPYGQTTTYGALAKRLGGVHMSAQAVGGAVGHNPISIIVPCHRVVGTNGSLTGYAGGLERKIRLLEIEQTDMHELFRPKKRNGTMRPNAPLREKLSHPLLNPQGDFLPVIPNSAEENAPPVRFIVRTPNQRGMPNEEMVCGADDPAPDFDDRRGRGIFGRQRLLG